MNYMLDCETLSVKPDACLLQIGVVPFDDDKIYEGRAWWVADDTGAMDPQTWDWWKRIPIVPPKFEERLPLKQALGNLTEFMQDIETVWSHPAGFDCVVLGQAYWRAQRTGPPWSYKQVRDTLTLREVAPDAQRPTPTDKHDALADAIAQAQWVINMKRSINGR